MNKYSSGWDAEAILGLIMAIIILIAVIISIIITVNFYQTDNTYVVTVTDKVVKNSDDSGKYLIYTTVNDTGEVRVFENTDLFWGGKWNSSDIQASIQIGKTYKFKTLGWRWPRMSWYEDIVEYREVN